MSELISSTKDNKDYLRGFVLQSAVVLGCLVIASVVLAFPTVFSTSLPGINGYPGGITVKQAPQVAEAIANDEDDLMQLLDTNVADYTFLDLDCGEEKRGRKKKAMEIASRIQQKHPKIELVGICDSHDDKVSQMAAGIGIKRVVTRPIKNREILEALV